MTTSLPDRTPRNLRLQIALVIALLIAGLIISGLIVQQRRSEEKFLAKRVGLSELHVNTVAMESDIRAYILTGNQLFLERLDKSSSSIKEHYDQLRSDPVITAELETTEADFNQWQTIIYDQVIPLVKQGELTKAEAINQVNSNSINYIIAHLAQSRIDLREIANQNNRKIDMLNWVQLANIGLLTVLLLSSLFTALNSWRRELRLGDDLRATSDELIKTNTDLQTSIQTEQATNERLQLRFDESRLMTQINDLLIKTISPTEAYTTIAQQVGTLLEGWCSIMMQRPNSNDGTMDVVGLYHPNPEKLQAVRDFVSKQPIVSTEGLHRDVFLKQDEVVMLNVPHDVSHPPSANPENAKIADIINLTSYIATPIMVNNQVAGVISVASSDDNYHFEQSQVLFLNQVADRIGTWLENIRLFLLAEKRAKELQLSFDSINDLIIAYDAAGHIIRLNKAAREFWNDHPFDAFDSQTIWRTAKGVTLVAEEHPLKIALSGTPVSDVEVELIRADGERIIHTVSISPISIMPDVVSGAVLVARDLTTRKELDRLKEELVANMSHELRTPLTAILGYSELLLKRRTDNLTPWHVSKVEGIRSGGQRLLMLVNDVLDLAKLDAGRIELHRHAVDLNELLQNQVNLLQPVINDHQQEIKFMLSEQPVVAIIDPDRISQVVMNLLSNASKFTPEQGTITLYSTQVTVNDDASVVVETPNFPTSPPMLPPGEYVMVAIHDTGVGIPAEETERLWDRFYQVEGGSTRRFGGTGLGLAIVQQLLELHHGQVWMHSPGENQGSLFAFILPVGDMTSEPTLALSLQEKTILIVEEHALDAQRFERELSDFGFNTAVVHSGNEAIDWLKTNTPVAIMLNPSVKDMSHQQLSEALSDIPGLGHDIPIIITSDHIPAHIIENLHVATYLIKPFTTEALLNTVQKFVTLEFQQDGYVLVVDDDVEMASLLAQTLQEHGYNTQAAYDGSAAMTLLQTEVIPSLILLDLMMPIIDGFQFLRWLRQQELTRHVPVIIITARDLTNNELKQLRKQSQGVQLKHTLKMDNLISEVQRFVPLKDNEE